jgi:hypothetical protein
LALKLKRSPLIYLSFIAIALIVLPHVLLRLTDSWMIRLIASLLLWLLLPTIIIFQAFIPFKYWGARKTPPKFVQILARLFLIAGGLACVMYFTIPYIKGASRLVINGGKLEKVTGVVKRVDVQYPTSIYSVDFKIEGRDNEISLCYWPRGVARRFKAGTKAEFYLLPGTDYAMDVRPASAN